MTTAAAILQTVITKQIVFNELIKAVINRDNADDLVYRYYKNEFTHKDIEYLKKILTLKLKMLRLA
ncbi:hypothetical protein F9Y90_05580 (plasmid) [Borrelia miyamotoi]|uniref:Bdr family repetitive protein n=1 Tax=Borrelia miyamotoi TaxID=47466 RepID=A0A5P8AUL9_9SPIR|nr:Bdr family repetitive protein [Borrelia miyamotoi]QFP42562.1 hypothetical protein F9Y90_05580 [Borrelia miyamotoi]WAZ72895.1 Bdr family repetitive protein [Borrelia miyamotoi]WVI05724.1 Bdr family repetitive protein [Borrelia miyamotoi]